MAYYIGSGSISIKFVDPKESLGYCGPIDISYFIFPPTDKIILDLVNNQFLVQASENGDINTYNVVFIATLPNRKT